MINFSVVTECRLPTMTILRRNLRSFLLRTDTNWQFIKCWDVYKSAVEKQCRYSTHARRWQKNKLLLDNYLLFSLSLFHTTPPCLSFSIVVVVGLHVDKAVGCGRWRTITRAAAENSPNRLQEVQAVAILYGGLWTSRACGVAQYSSPIHFVAFDPHATVRTRNWVFGVRFIQSQGWSDALCYCTILLWSSSPTTARYWCVL